jgi:hypothetical protein
MKDQELGFDDTEFKVRVRVADRGVVTTAIASLSHGQTTLTARGEGRAHPASQMRRVRKHLAVGRALAELGRKLQAAAADEYTSVVNSVTEPKGSSRSVA